MIFLAYSESMVENLKVGQTQHDLQDPTPEFCRLGTKNELGRTKFWLKIKNPFGIRIMPGNGNHGYQNNMVIKKFQVILTAR